MAVGAISIVGYMPLNLRKSHVLTSSLTLASFDLTPMIYL